MEHLSEEARIVCLENQTDRIRHVNSDRWIGYTQAKHILTKFDDLLHLPIVDRMPNILLVGDTNNGKSAILNRFTNLNRPYVKDDEDCLNLPVFFLQAPPVPDEHRFYNLILEKSFTPHKKHDRIDRKLILVLNTLKKLNVKILVIDEIHHILSGTANKQRTFLYVLKYLSNELKISIIGAGIKDAYFAINSDPQLGGRFTTYALPRWEMGEEYLRLLMTFERMLPLQKPSGLHQMALANRILSLSEGTIGEISNVLKEASIKAIKSNKEFIDVSILEKLEYVSPSNRKKLIDRLGV